MYIFFYLLEICTPRLVLLGLYVGSAFNTKVLPFPLRSQIENDLIYHIFWFIYICLVCVPQSCICFHFDGAMNCLLFVLVVSNMELKRRLFIKLELVD